VGLDGDDATAVHGLPGAACTRPLGGDLNEVIDRFVAGYNNS